MDLRLTDFGISAYFPENSDQLLKDVDGTPGYMAPEMVEFMFPHLGPDDSTKIGYHKEIDMLIGYPPFWSKDQSTLFKLILNCKFETKMVRFKKSDQSCKELIEAFLIKDPAKRIDIDRAIEMPFCKIHEFSRDDYIDNKNDIGDFDIKTLVEIENPYNLNMMRELIDTCSFSVYNHWISNEKDNKNRASLYQTDMNLSS
ncbi:MAG: Phosphorylase b kinase gamma catalytic chain, skeletal muscle/heart isoform [Paramarteilia canceri]